MEPEVIGRPIRENLLRMLAEAAEVHELDSHWLERLVALGWPSLPAFVVQPDNYTEAAAVVAACADAGAALVPVGGGTHLGWGSHPRRVDVILDLNRLDKIVDYTPDDMYVTVQAGCRYDQLQRQLAQHGQFVPVDPFTMEQSTVGGVVTCDPHCLWHGHMGNLRDYVIGTRVIQASGEITYSGSRVMKNVAGLELPKLYTGSLGTLGVLLEITLKVRPLPTCWGLVAAPLSSWARAEDSLGSLLSSELQPVLLELTNHEALTTLNELAGVAPHSGPVLFVGFADSEPNVNWQIDRCKSLIQNLTTSQVQQIPWAVGYPALHALLTPLQSHASLIATVISSEVAAFCADAEAICAARDVSVKISARGLSGAVNLHLYCKSVPTGSDETAVESVLCETINELQTRANTLPGSLPGFRENGCGNAILINASPAVRQKVAVWGKHPSTLRLMQEMKRRLDPDSIFNPGRFVGGI